MVTDGARTGGPGRRGRYHHGDLATALVDEGVTLLAEVGWARFSAAELARRVGVSTAAPYRHFADRDRLLAAVATRVATTLASALRTAVDEAGPDAVDQLAAAGGAYADVVARHRVGIDAVYAPPLRALADPGLAAAGRAVMDVLAGPADRLAGDPRDALELVEQVVALAHGYGTLDAEGFLTADRFSGETTRERARRAVLALVGGDARGSG